MLRGPWTRGVTQSARPRGPVFPLCVMGLEPHRTRTPTAAAAALAAHSSPEVASVAGEQIPTLRTLHRRPRSRAHRRYFAPAAVAKAVRPVLRPVDGGARAGVPSTSSPIQFTWLRQQR